MKTIAVKLPDELFARLDEASRRKSLGRSAVVRQALIHYLEADAGKPATGSFAQQAAAFAGCVEGPSDLSHGKRHMKGYGR